MRRVRLGEFTGVGGAAWCSRCVVVGMGEGLAGGGGGHDTPDETDVCGWILASRAVATANGEKSVVAGLHSCRCAASRCGARLFRWTRSSGGRRCRFVPWHYAEACWRKGLGAGR
jgi:hypothetical protein